MLFLCAEKIGSALPIASQSAWDVPIFVGGANV